MITMVQGFLMGLVACGPLLYPGEFTFSLANLIWYRWVGVFMVVSGMIIALSATREMGSSLTPWPKPKQNGKLVTSGVFRYTRNPIYLGLIIASYGWALSQWSIISLLGAAILRFWLSVKISKEEEFLEEQFGDDYLDYLKKTARLIPGIGKG
jgi:protein-S-isoprenylcysteine O-methyltransferase Ste14